LKKTFVYDLPTRLFHWFFALFFVGAYGIANTFEKDSVIFSFHALIGLTMLTAVICRVGWGFTGSKYARFNSFALRPVILKQYILDFFSSRAKIFTGHNPGSSWAAVMMMSIVVLLSISGILIASGVKGIKDVHEIMAHLFLAFVVLHVLGVILHTIRHRDPIALSMVGGYKNLENGKEEIKDSHPIIALLFIGFLGYVATHLFTQFNPSTKTLSLMGKDLKLGKDRKIEVDVNHDVD
jgi:cytochrome b